MINFVSPPEWIHIESVADGNSDQSGAEWQQVDFNLPPNTLKAVAEFIVSQIRPRDGIHLSEIWKRFLLSIWDHPLHPANMLCLFGWKGCSERG
ncbi:hypothetical protein QPK13_22420 [Photorhabdus tasmaniensis]